MDFGNLEEFLPTPVVKWGKGLIQWEITLTIAWRIDSSGKAWMSETN